MSGDAFRLTASARTSIVSLGLLSTRVNVCIVVGSVSSLVAFHTVMLGVFRRIVGEAKPPRSTRVHDP